MTNHTLKYYFTSIDAVKLYSGPALFVFIQFWFYAIYLILGLIIRIIYGEGYECVEDLSIFKKFSSRSDVIEIEEGLDDYIDNLSYKDIEWTWLENEYYKEYEL